VKHIKLIIKGIIILDEKKLNVLRRKRKKTRREE